MVGHNATEFTLFMMQDQAAYALDDAGLEARVLQMFGADNGPWLLETYRADVPDYALSAVWFRLFSDHMMGALSKEIPDVCAANGSGPLYAYRFNWMTPIEEGKPFSPHTIETPFVFGNATTEAGQIMTGGGEAVAQLAATVSEAWVQFAATGRPAAPGLPDWPEYDGEARQAIHIDSESHIAPISTRAARRCSAGWSGPRPGWNDSIWAGDRRPRPATCEKGQRWATTPPSGSSPDAPPASAARS